MSDQIDYFSDLLEPDEPIRAAIGGPGAPEPGLGAIWLQLAVTPERIIVVKLVVGKDGQYHPEGRHVAQRTDVGLARFPRTDRTSARLEISGFEIPITMVDIDAPEVFPLVEPFIVAWGGRLGGAGTVRPSAPKPGPHQTSTMDGGKLILLAGLVFGMFLTCCGGAGILVSIKQWAGGGF